jgi:hypothetical protein
MKRIPSFKQLKNKLLKVTWAFIARLCRGRSLVCDYESRVPFSLVAMTGRKIHRMTEQMVFSFCQSWEALPQRLIVISDGTRSAQKIRKDFSFWKGDVEIADWKQCLSDYSGDLDTMKNFCDSSIYGRKFVSMLHYAKQEPILFSDSDVLWFDKMLDVPSGGNQFCIKLSEDLEHSYNEDLIDHMGWDRLRKSGPMNVGVVYLNGDFVKQNPWADEAIRELGPSYQFPEQTIMAAASAGDCWPLSTVYIGMDDLHSKLARRGEAARHYVSNGKIKFWRDAAQLNLSFHQKK